MIKGTSADCKIKSITITDSTAAISCILYSLSPTKEPKGFRFYIKDKDITKPLLGISENIYWIDRINNYTNDSKNINTNGYIEILLKVNLNNNQGDLIGNRWIKKCNLVLRDIQDPLNKFSWVSEDLILISEEFEIPTIKNLNIYSDKDYNMYINFTYKYTSQSDFNYNNKNLYTTIKLISPFTDTTLETLDIEEEKRTSKVSAKPLGTYSVPVKILIQLKNQKHEILYTLEKLYNPIIKRTSTFIKTINGVENVLAFYIKDAKLDNPIIKKTESSTPKEATPLKVNFNAANINLDYILQAPLAKFKNKTICFTNPNVDNFTNNLMQVKLGDIILTETQSKYAYYTLNEVPETKQHFSITIEGTSSYYSKQETFEIELITATVCSNNILCSNNLYPIYLGGD